MKTTLRKGFLAVLLILIVPGSSWAMGHHHSGSSSKNDSGNGSDGSSNGNGYSDGNGPSNGNDQENENNQGPVSGINGTGSSNQTNGNNFPVAPVPEPMTMSLLGTGLAGIFLRKRM